MPPKKKEKKVKEAETLQEVQPEPEQRVFRIPKKPFYRSVLLDSREQLKHIQIKLWKINSLKNKFSWEYLDKTISRLSKKQRVFKNLRRLDCCFHTSKKIDMNQLISKSWRLEKWILSNYYYGFDRLIEMRKCVKSKKSLKNLFLNMDRSQEYIEKSIDEWKCLVNCNVWFGNYPVLALNTRNIRSLRRFLKGSNKNQVIESVEMISQEFSDNKEEELGPFSSKKKKKNIFDLSLMNANQLPNLKILQVNYFVGDFMKQPYPTVDIIKDYPQITTLILCTEGKYAHSFEFLSCLPNLKQLAILYPWSYRANKISKTLPLIHSLEKLKIPCNPGEFSPENLQEFFTSNKNLKSLEVDFPLQEDYLIFHENLILPIEKLKLKLEIPDNKKCTMIAKKLAAFLGKNQHLKSLEIYLPKDTPLDCCEILQKGITLITGLDQLVWHGILPGQLEDIQLKEWKKIFNQNPGIQKLELDFGGGVLMSRSASSFIDGLASLKKLKYLALRVSFFRISPATAGKFLEFLRFLVFENVATVKLDLPGISEEMIEEINFTKKYYLFSDKIESHNIHARKW